MAANGKTVPFYKISDYCISYPCVSQFQADTLHYSPTPAPSFRLIPFFNYLIILLLFLPELYTLVFL